MTVTHFQRFFTVALLLGLASPAMSQDQGVTTQEQAPAASAETAAPAPTDVLTETFDGEERTLFLGGQIDLTLARKVWQYYVDDGRLVFENRQEPQNLHYNDINWVNFPGSQSIETTENMVISVVVEAENTARGGAGFIVGSGIAGVYMMFSVDKEGRFHILQKDGRKLRAVHSADHSAIRKNAPNELTFERRVANIAFFVNGTQVVQIPYPSMFARQRPGQAGIGIAAFGLGKFYFDRVDIRRAE